MIKIPLMHTVVGLIVVMAAGPAVSAAPLNATLNVTGTLQLTTCEIGLTSSIVLPTLTAKNMNSVSTTTRAHWVDVADYFTSALTNCSPGEIIHGEFTHSDTTNYTGNPSTLTKTMSFRPANYMGNAVPPQSVAAYNGTMVFTADSSGNASLTSAWGNGSTYERVPAPVITYSAAKIGLSSAEVAGVYSNTLNITFKYN
jgi:hypothetical protein